jgi:hypothetical protein
VAGSIDAPFQACPAQMTSSGALGEWRGKSAFSAGALWL